MDNPPSVAESADAPSIERPSPTAANSADARALISAWGATAGDRDKAALFLLAGIMGCRRGEVCGWRWSDFGADAGGLTVQRAISMGHGPEERRTKTKRERRIAVTVGTVAVLATQWDAYAAACNDAAITPDSDSFIFSGRLDHSTPMNPGSVTQAFGRLRTREVNRLRAEAAKTGDVELARQAARLAKVQLGHFRHFAATQMVSGGVDIKTASAKMGRDGAVFMRHYTSVIDQHDREAAALLESLFIPALALPGAASTANADD